MYDPNKVPSEDEYEAIYDVWFCWAARNGAVKRRHEKALWMVYAMSERDALEKAVVEMGRVTRLANRQSALVKYPPDYAFVQQRVKDSHCHVRRMRAIKCQNVEEVEWFQHVSHLEPRHHDEMRGE